MCPATRNPPLDGVLGKFRRGSVGEFGLLLGYDSLSVWLTRVCCHRRALRVSAMLCDMAIDGNFGDVVPMTCIKGRLRSSVC